MATKYRVIAHGMHESEIGFAAQTMPEGVVTKAFVTGDADESAIEKLRKGGLIVDIVCEIDDEDRPKELRPETPGLGAQAIPGRVRPITFSTSFSLEDLQAAPEVDLTHPNVFLIQINGPLLEEYVEALSALGVELIDSFRHGFYSAFLTFDQVDQVRELKFVAGALLYDRSHTSPSRAAGFRTLAPPEIGPRQLFKYDIVLHRAEDRDKITKWLEDRDVAIEGLARRKIRVSMFEDSRLRAEIDNLPEVKLQEQYVEPTLANDVARRLLNIEKHAGTTSPLDGNGQIVAIADTGIDQQHPDFAGRIVAVLALGTQGRTDDLHGHGTHVAGSLVGSGAASGGQPSSISSPFRTAAAFSAGCRSI
jgi:serine protease AprX